MQVSTESYPDSGVYAMRHLEMYMGDVDKWNPGFKKFNVSLLITLWFIIMLYSFMKFFYKFLVFLSFLPLYRKLCWRSLGLNIATGWSTVRKMSFVCRLWIKWKLIMMAWGKRKSRRKRNHKGGKVKDWKTRLCST